MKYISLSKSKYCKAKQCNKILWLDKNKPEEEMNQFWKMVRKQVNLQETTLVNMKIQSLIMTCLK